jgi:SARP family transcriptional regulator, regulator of embCAB operon
VGIVSGADWLYLGRTLGDPVRIQLCGPLVLRIGGARVEGLLPGRQGELLLAYLVCHRGTPVARERLIDAIWPRGAPPAASSALSALISKVRRALNTDWIEGRSDIVLRLPGAAFVDLEAAREAVHRAESAIALEHWSDGWGPARVALHTANRGVLVGLEAPWIDAIRHEVEGIRLRALESVAAAGLGLGGPELASAERAARRLIDLDPYNESGYCCLMETLARRDQIAEALRVYEGLRGLLRDELGIAPGKPAQALHLRLLGHRSEMREA